MCAAGGVKMIAKTERNVIIAMAKGSASCGVCTSWPMTNGQQLGLHTEKNYHKNSRQLEGVLSKNVD